MINIFIKIVSLSIPISLLYLYISHPDVHGRLFFSLFIIFAAVERIWETFYIQKGKGVRDFHGDWSLFFTIITYYLISLLLIFAFYDTEFKNIYVVISGLLLFVCSTIIRFWAVKLLGVNWNIHLVDKFQNKGDSNLIQRGPYILVRHPIYLAAILELIGLTLISNAYYYLIFILVINIPLYVWRAKHEENLNIKKFNREYLDYMKKVPFIIPYKFFKNIKK